MPLCARCRLAGAGLRYQGRLWFHPMCWRFVRAVAGEDVAGYLTERAKIAENGAAETTALTVAPANPISRCG